jgi:NADH:ubiquinone oxidoreductase subunit 2 (subunit N)
MHYFLLCRGFYLRSVHRCFRYRYSGDMKSMKSERIRGVQWPEWGEYPLLAIALTVFMLSMAGIPPLAGFFGRCYVYF